MFCNCHQIEIVVPYTSPYAFAFFSLECILNYKSKRILDRLQKCSGSVAFGLFCLDTKHVVVLLRVPIARQSSAHAQTSKSEFNLVLVETTINTGRQMILLMQKSLYIDALFFPF